MKTKVYDKEENKNRPKGLFDALKTLKSVQKSKGREEKNQNL